MKVPVLIKEVQIMVEKGKGFQIFAHILFIILVLCAIAPFILLIMSSFTEEQTLITNGYSFFSC